MAMASLFTLIDDIASMLDDVALMSKIAAKKTVGVVGDDLALNANQVTGVAANRELPIVWAVARGSLINKCILIPIALVLAIFAPKMITPLLMLGGAYLCFEGVEKLLHKITSHEATHKVAQDNLYNESDKIKGAIRTDFILSAEIIILALGEIDTIANASWIGKLLALAIVGVAITIFVYGIVAMIVKIDDIGFYLMRKKNALVRFLGSILVRCVPFLMRGLSVVGTIAMFMVGGGIFTHNVEYLHHFQWQNTWLNMGFTIGIGLIVGALACIIVLPIVNKFEK